METLNLFTAALNLSEPWQVEKVDFRKTENGKLELHIDIGFKKGGTFACPVDGCGETVTAYDSSERTWRHLNFFQYKTFIHARQPRIKCKEHGVKTVDVPWARPGSGFTLLFEGWCLELAKHVPVSVIAEMVDENDTRLWRFIRHHVDEARSHEDYSEVTAVGIDETSKKGHNYITVAVDLHEKKVIYAVDGKDSSTVKSFADDFVLHGGNAGKIGVITCDMSLGFRKGIRERFQNARMVIDKFHVIKHANESVDSTRKSEAKKNAELKGTKYLWLKNEKNLSEAQKEKKESLMKLHLKTGRALMMREELQDIYEAAGTRKTAETRLNALCSWIMHSRISEMKPFAKLVRNHFDEILNYFEHQYTNAILEGMNSIIQNIKRRARGFRNTEFFKTMIYLVCGKFPLEKYAVMV